MPQLLDRGFHVGTSGPPYPAAGETAPAAGRWPRRRQTPGAAWTRPRRFATFGLGTLGALWVAVAAGVLCLRGSRVVVSGASMSPTLEAGDRLLVWRRAIPAVGDLVAVEDPELAGRLLVKRVRAISGSELELRGDNEPESRDSRSFGPVARTEVVGVVVYRYMPSDKAGRMSGLTPTTLVRRWASTKTRSTGCSSLRSRGT